jgi:hypothetical protein
LAAGTRPPRRQHEPIVDAALRGAATVRRIGGHLQAAAGSGTINVGEPLVNLVADLETFEHHLAKTAGQPTADIDPRTFLDRRCETIDGHQIAGGDLVAASVAGHVRRVVFDGASAVVDIGRKRRLFTGPLRDVLSLIERTCPWPGCGLPARQCEGDHVRPWRAGGGTSAANGAPLCGHHNRFKQRHGYRTWRDPDGVWHAARPDGTEIGLANAPPSRWREAETNERAQTTL